MKYFAGAPEDHTNKKYDGIVGYENKKGVQTFGKKELKDILAKVGFKFTNFYYPLPDYKLPNIIFSDEYLPDENTINNYTVYYGEGTEIEFDEKEAYIQAIKNGVFDIFSNSFFVEASSKEINTKVDLSKQELVPISDISKNFYNKDYSKRENNIGSQIEELRLQNETLINNLRTIEKSTSWKITKPLRAINKMFKKNK